MFVPDLYRNPHRLAQLGRRHQVHPARAEGARVKLLVFADYYLPGLVVDLNHVQRRTGGYAKSLALPDREVVNSGVLADHLAVGGNHFAGNHLARNLLSSNASRFISVLRKIGFEKALVVAAGDETDFLRVGLFGDRETVLAGQFAYLGLGHTAKGEQSAAQLFLRET